MIEGYSSKEASEKAYQIILEEHNSNISNIQTGLLSRFTALNAIIGRYFRFGKSYIICGSSGTGKSYLLNAIISDFASREIIKLGTTTNGEDWNINPVNHRFQDKFVILNFNLEMKAEDEKLRSLSALLGRSYSHLLSSAYQLNEEGEFVYNTLTDYELKLIQHLFDNVLAKQNILYFPGRIKAKEIYEVAAYYRGLGYKVVVAIDHLLLIDEDSSQELALVKEVGEVSDKMKKELNAMVIILNQMNDNILNLQRLSMPAKHYPEMTDGYGGRITYHYADYYIFLHRPARIGIDKYGKDKFSTRVFITPEIVDIVNNHNKSVELYPTDIGQIYDIIHFLVHKNRFGGDIQSIFTLSLLNRGKFIKIPYEILQ